MTKILQYVNNKHRAGLHWYLSNPISHWKEVSRMNILDDLWYFIFHHGNIIKKGQLVLASSWKWWMQKQWKNEKFMQ